MQEYKRQCQQAEERIANLQQKDIFFETVVAQIHKHLKTVGLFISSLSISLFLSLSLSLSLSTILSLFVLFSRVSLLKLPFYNKVL
jgi:hypothetical protein